MTNSTIISPGAIFESVCRPLTVTEKKPILRKALDNKPRICLLMRQLEVGRRFRITRREAKEKKLKVLGGHDPTSYLLISLNSDQHCVIFAGVADATSSRQDTSFSRSNTSWYFSRSVKNRKKSRQTCCLRRLWDSG